jgi:two-component system sensor histidine kinase and response regulator WspE
MSSNDELNQMSLEQLFQQEAATQTQVLGEGLLALERAPRDVATLEACMRAAHSLKGAARIVGVPLAVAVAHVIEECFVAAQRDELALDPTYIDDLLRGVDLLARTSESEPGPGLGDEVDAYVAAFTARLAGDTPVPMAAPASLSASLPVYRANPVAAIPQDGQSSADEREPQFSGPAPGLVTGLVPGPANRPGAPPGRPAGRGLRVSAAHLDRILGLAGESLVESRALKPFAESLLRLKRLQGDAGHSLELLQQALAMPAKRHGQGATTQGGPSPEEPPGEGQGQREAAQHALEEVRRLLAQSQQLLAARINELDVFEHRYTNLAQQSYEEALACRMRPFRDGITGYARLVRDFARSLGKQARLEIVGASTEVDRDILELLDAPLGHLLRNALDHGIETPEVRLAKGKPAEGVIVLEARHGAGMLQVSIADDGAGIDLDAVRAAVIRRALVNADTGAQLSDAELLEFLLLPGFSMRAEVSDVSGRGVGLDVVHDMVRQVHGTVRISAERERGTRLQLSLPPTLSVVRGLIVEIGGEPYALPLAQVARTLELEHTAVALLEGRQYVESGGRQIGIVNARQVLKLADGEDGQGGKALAIVVLGSGNDLYGVVVDRFLGERTLVVQPLDPRLGKIKDIAAGALMENGDPLLIIDVGDLLRSVEKLVSGDALDPVAIDSAAAAELARRRKRVLVVDDSLTVRELERKLLTGRGYDVTVAVDGMDGWNALRSEAFDLVVTDIDMPRMDGIELVGLIRQDQQRQALPVLIVSYKDREEDRRRGLDAGADYYLAKSSFNDAALLDAVRDLIGEANA